MTIGTVTTMYGDVIPAQSIYEQSLVAKHRIGDRARLGERTFRYARVGGVAIAAGVMTAGASTVANHLNCVAGTTSVGSTRVTVTLGATAVTRNEYADGYLHINTGDGIGVYKIKSHLAIGSSGSGVINLYDPIVSALVTATTRVTLTKNPWADVVIAPTTVAQIPTGVFLRSMALGSFGWIQTGGPCLCLVGAGPPTVGQAVMMSTATAGAVVVATAGNPVVGWMMRSNAATHYALVYLTIST